MKPDPIAMHTEKEIDKRKCRTYKLPKHCSYTNTSVADKSSIPYNDPMAMPPPSPPPLATAVDAQIKIIYKKKSSTKAESININTKCAL